MAKSSGNGNSRGRGFIPDNGIGAGGGIRTHVAQRTTGFQAVFSRLELYACCARICSIPGFPHGGFGYALGDPGS